MDIKKELIKSFGANNAATALSIMEGFASIDDKSALLATLCSAIDLCADRCDVKSTELVYGLRVHIEENERRKLFL